MQCEMKVGNIAAGPWRQAPILSHSNRPRTLSTGEMSYSKLPGSASGLIRSLRVSRFANRQDTESDISPCMGCVPTAGLAWLSGTEQSVLAQTPCWPQLHARRNACNSFGRMQVPARAGTEQMGSHDVAARWLS
jgi:hypothetical protein